MKTNKDATAVAVSAGEEMARATAEFLKGADLMFWAAEQFKAAELAASEGHALAAKRLAAAGTLASSMA